MPKTTWKLKNGITWSAKLKQAHPSHGKIVEASSAQKKSGLSRLLIPKPLDVDAVIRKVPKGKLITVRTLREQLAQHAGADAACPMTTGICVRIVAEAAEEARRAGKKRITPYWRVVRNDGGLNQKFPGGTTAQAKHLRHCARH